MVKRDKSASLRAPSDSFVSSGLPCSILRLFLGSGPSTIRRLIISIIIDSVNRMPNGWSLSHIGKKIFKRGRPSFAHRDSSTSIAMIRTAFCITTASDHVLPNNIFIRSLSLRPRTMSSRRIFNMPAAFDSRKMILPHQLEIPAVAKASPEDATRSMLAGWPSRNQTTEPFPCKLIHFNDFTT